MRPSEPCVYVQPDRATAERQAARCGARVEALEERTPYRQIFANADGSSTLEMSPVPARVQQPDGSWVPVSSKLDTAADGRIRPHAALSDLSFSPGGDEPLAILRQAGKDLVVDWPNPLPPASVNGNVATYPDVFPGVDLQMLATDTGFTHVLVVKTPEAAKLDELKRVVFTVGGDARVNLMSDGRVRFHDERNRTMFTARPTFAWDSTYDAAADGEVEGTAPAEPPPGAHVSSSDGPGAGAVVRPLRVSTTGTDLIIEPDQQMLRDPATTFPVYLDPEISPSYGKWAYANSGNKDWSVDKNRAYVGFHVPDGTQTRYRSYFDFPTTSGKLSIKGTHVLDAKFVAMLDHSYSCGDSPAYLFRPKGGAIPVKSGKRMKFDLRPLGKGVKYLASAKGHANEAGGCGGKVQPDQLMEFESAALTSDLQAVAKSKAGTYSVGLCACDKDGDGESEQSRWKKFFADSRVKLSVTYNSYPTAPSELSPHKGEVGCGSVIGTTKPVIQARFNDPDSADKLSSTFHWKQLPSGAVKEVAGPTKPAKNIGSVTLDLGNPADGTSYQFRVGTKDKHDTSPPSSWCTFTVDRFAPGPPSVSSTDYPRCVMIEVVDCKATGGPGVAGSFVFAPPADNTGKDIVSYSYGWTNPPTRTENVVAGATTRPIPLTPPRFGLNVLYVRAKDKAGKSSGVFEYKFMVDGPSAALGHWPLDDIRGVERRDLVSGQELTVQNLQWQSDVRYIGARSATFTGTSSAEGTVAGFDAGRAFSVAAWVRLRSTSCAGEQTVLSMNPNSGEPAPNSAVLLNFDCTGRKWRLRLPAVGQADAPVLDATLDAPVVAGRWTYLVGSWDPAEAALRLVADGAVDRSALAAPSAAWLAKRPAAATKADRLVLGRGRLANAETAGLDGNVGDVRVWNRVVTNDDIRGTAADPDEGRQAVPGLLNPLGVGRWSFDVDEDCECAQSAQDGAYFGRPLVLGPGHQDDSPTAWFTADDIDGNEALSFDGVAGYAAIDTLDQRGAILRTDQSFSVAAWVRVRNRAASGPQTLLSQGGTTRSAFRLSYEPDTKGWCFGLPAADAADAAAARACAPAADVDGDDWQFVVGVLDAAGAKALLYVDGTLAATTDLRTSPWQSGQSFVVGQGRRADGRSAEPFGGDVDLVQAWQGALTATQIDELFGEHEVQAAQ